MAKGVNWTWLAYCALLEAFQQKVTAAVPLEKACSSSEATKLALAFRAPESTMLLMSSRAFTFSVELTV